MTKKPLSPEMAFYEYELKAAISAAMSARKRVRECAETKKNDPDVRKFGGMASSSIRLMGAKMDRDRTAAKVKRLKEQGQLIEGIDYFQGAEPWNYKPESY